MSKVLKEEIAQNEQMTGTAVLSSEDQQVFDRVKAAIIAAEEKKALDVLLLRLTAITEFTDYFIICTGSSTRQTQAIADEVVEQLKGYGARPLNTEGYNSAEWILIDYGSFIVHIFTEESRRFYDLERLWRDAERVEL
jgi:ribosome-associated protein